MMNPTTVNYDIPTYLLATDVSLANFVRQQQPPILTSCSIDMEKLREIAILLYHCKIIDLEIALWSTFLKSGTDHGQNNNAAEHGIYLDSVQRHLQQFKQQKECFLRQLNENITTIEHYHRIMEPCLQLFFQDKFNRLQMDYEHRIALIGYDYEEKRLAYEIQAEQQLNDHDVRLLCFSLVRFYTKEFFFSSFLSLSIPYIKRCKCIASAS